MQIKIRDRMFVEDRVVSTHDQRARPRYFEWYRGDEPRRLTVFTDLDLEAVEDSESEVKVAWMLESPAVTRRSYQLIRRLHPKFDQVLTFDQKLLRLDDRFVYCPLGGCWIRPEDRRVHPKTELVSLIASRKARTQGQRLRLRVAEAAGGRLAGHLYGRAFQEVADKLEALGRYRYSIVIENCRSNYYFTEKLIDALAVGTIPIYWGCPDIERFFDPRGVLSFKRPRQLQRILRTISEADYEARLDAVRNNFERSRRYWMVEDNLWELCLKRLV